MTSGKLFLGGVPTDSDVRKLREVFGTPEEGKLIPYGKVAEVLGISKDSNRFRTVTAQWRRRLYLDQNIVIGVRANEGFVALSPTGRLVHGRTKVREGMRKIRRATVVLGTTDRGRLTAKEAVELDHEERISKAIIHAGHLESKRITGPTSAPTLRDKRE